MGAATNKNRRAESRNRLLDAASELFADQGYDDTTLDAVAELAGLHVQTLYRHFPCKADLAAEIWHRSLDDFEAFFDAREVDTLAAWREWIEFNVRLTPNTINTLAGRYAPPSSRIFEYWDQFQQILAEGLAGDMGLDVGSDLRPTLFACMLWGGNQKVALGWIGKRWDRELVVASLVEVVDSVELLIHKSMKGEKRLRAATG